MLHDYARASPEATKNGKTTRVLLPGRMGPTRATTGSAFMADTPHTFVDVLVLHQTDVGWLCEIDGRRVFVAKLQIEPGTMMPGEGQRGPVTIATFAVDDITEKIGRRHR